MAKAAPDTKPAAAPKVRTQASGTGRAAKVEAAKQAIGLLVEAGRLTPGDAMSLVAQFV